MIIKYQCKNCGRTYSAAKKNKVILCEKCKTDANREKQKNKYVPKSKDQNFFYIKHQRNKEVAQAFDDGVKIVEIAKMFNVSSTRIRQILQKRRTKVWDSK